MIGAGFGLSTQQTHSSNHSGKRESIAWQRIAETTCLLLAANLRLARQQSKRQFFSASPCAKPHHQCPVTVESRVDDGTGVEGLRVPRAPVYTAISQRLSPQATNKPAPLWLSGARQPPGKNGRRSRVFPVVSKASLSSLACENHNDIHSKSCTVSCGGHEYGKMAYTLIWDEGFKNSRFAWTLFASGCQSK
jgi:hypothetical protein